MIEQWQELKETIIEMRDNDGTGTQQEVCKFLANLMDILEKQMIGSGNPNKWIPVSERLPEKNVEVLVTTEWDCITIGEMFSSNDWFIHEGATNADIDDIKAWMPLPKPYESQERSGKE